MRNTILFLILIVSNTLSAQTFEWAKTFGGAINDGAYSTKVDSAGNIYTSGFFGGTVDFDPGPGLNNRTSVGGFDVFVTKMGPLGNFIWARTFGGNSTDEGYSLDVDPAGNVYTTGSFKGSVDFDPGSGTFILYSANYSVFVQKLDSSGNFLWAKTFGGPNHDEGVDISVDAYGNAFTTGLFSGTVDFDPGPGVSSITSSNTSMFIQKLDASGNFLWAKSTVGNIVERGYGVCVDGASNVYITGTFLGVADFDPGAGTAFLSSTGYCVYVQKLDSSGNFLWAKSFGESTQSWGWAIDVDYSGNVYTTGYFENTADFDPGPGTFLMTALDRDAYVQKMDSLGNFLWAKSIKGTNGNESWAINVDGQGNIYTAGTFYDTIDCNPNGVPYQLVAVGYFDIFLQKLDPSGNFVWAKSIGGTGFAFDVARSITTDNAGNVYTSGLFENTADFDTGVGTFNLSSFGNRDVFLHKMSQCITPSSVDIKFACDSLTWLDGKTYYTNNNQSTWTITNSNGCDSLIFLDLTILNSSNAIDTQIACNSFTWMDGNTYTANNNSATWTLTNSAGCDSIITLDLTMLDNSSTDVIFACDSYTWIDGITYTTSNNTATWILPNTAGCDSLISLDLTLNHSTSGVSTLSACDSYTWIDGNTYTSNNNSSTWILTNAAGCDSIVTLDLTIKNSNSGIDTRTECNSFTWIDGITYFANNNSATWLLTNVDGCDSLVTLNLVIQNSSSSIDSHAVCEPFEWIDGNTYTADNNTATWILANSEGCDSLVTLNLTVTSINTSTNLVNGVIIQSNNTSAQFQWLDCVDNYMPLNGQIGQSFYATTNGEYAVELTQNGCVDTSLCVAINSVGVFENDIEKGLFIYPNPTQNFITIDLGEQTKATAIITDLSGKIIDTKGILSGEKIDLTFLASGTYLIQISCQKVTKVFKVVKEK